MTTAPSARANDRLAALFPDPDEPNAASSSWWPPSKRRAIVAGALALLLTVVVATRAFGSDGAELRTAAVGRHEVDAQLTGVATIEPVSQAAVAFPVSGTVGSVAVKVGDKVQVGQTLAELDPQTLLETLHTQEAALAQAKLTLERALSGESVGGTGSGNAPSTGSTGSAQGVSLGTSESASSSIALVSVRSTSSDPEIAAAQQAVLQAQQAVDAAIATASTALDSASAICATVATPEQVTACQAAINGVLAAQNDVRSAQNTLADASNALDALLDQKANEPPPGTPTTPPTIPTSPPPTMPTASPPATVPTSPDAGSGAPSTGGAPSGGASSSSPSAADLASYQQAVDAAAANVAVAEQSLQQATIASPLDGKVVAVNLSVDDDVTAASTDATVVVQGSGGYEVATTVSVERVSDVAIGQRATVVPDGSHEVLSGKVAYISAVPRTSDSSSTTSYLVVVGLDKSDADLKNGSTGTVSIVTDHAKSALAVPTSSVVARGSGYVVEVPDGDETRTVEVRVGAIGETWTEIESGLDAGDEVVIADLAEALPGSATSSSDSTGAGGTGFPAGFPTGGGGFPGGGPGG